MKRLQTTINNLIIHILKEMFTTRPDECRSDWFGMKQYESLTLLTLVKPKTEATINVQNSLVHFAVEEIKFAK